MVSIKKGAKEMRMIEIKDIERLKNKGHIFVVDMQGKRHKLKINKPSYFICERAGVPNELLTIPFTEVKSLVFSEN